MQIALLLSLFFCHFLADYTHLSTAWMLNAKRLGKPLNPIFVHASIHAFLMWFIMRFIFNIESLLACKMMILQLFTHFLIDVWKGRMNGWFPSLQSPANKWHWIIFGLDQFFHTVVIIIMVHLIYY